MHLPAFRADRTRTDPTNNLVSTADTINKMIVLVQQNLNSPIIQNVLDRIFKQIDDSRGEPGYQPSEVEFCRAVFWWVKHHIHFDSDESALQRLFGIQDLEDGKELLLSPSFLLQMEHPTGDCDDFSTLIATLLIAGGVQGVHFCTIAADSNDPTAFTHVYVKVVDGYGNQFPLDASHGQYPGWETSVQYKQANWTVPSPITHTQTNPVSSPAPDTSADTTFSNLQPLVQNFLIQEIPFVSQFVNNPFLSAIGL